MSRYLIRVEGLLSPALTSVFTTLEATQHAQTVLHGQFADRAALAAVLGHLRSLGVDIVEVHCVPARADHGSTRHSTRMT